MFFYKRDLKFKVLFEIFQILNWFIRNLEF